MPRYAAIDIGSNSVRMETAEIESGGEMRVLAQDREVTRLGEGVYRDGRISAESAGHTCAVLARMAAQYKALSADGVRAVATSSVRDARNQEEFLQRASEAAGTTVEVISGREEARLVQLGVQARWPQQGKVLIVDIGGGSAEVIASENGHMLDAVSKPLGAVRLRQAFLGEDPPAAAQLRQLQDYIAEKLEGVPRRFGAAGWRRMLATSATAAAVASAIAGVPRAKRDRADRLSVPASHVRALYKKLSRLDLAARRRVSGVGPRRAEIIVPGVAVLVHILNTFGFRKMYYSSAGVRDGIVADLAARGVGRERARLNPDQKKEVVRLGIRYGVPMKHARKVAALAMDLFHALEGLHHLPMEYGKFLEAAAYLHDTGHYVNDASHHKHSYYLVANSELPGFTARERELIASLCRYHRKSPPEDHHANLRLLDGQEHEALVRLIPILRLADGLDRGHAQRIQSVECRVRNGQVELEVRSPKDAGLELWAADQVRPLFRETFGRALVLSHRSN
mgnify:CR=1 FL=1